MTMILELFMHLACKKHVDYYMFHEFLFKKSKFCIPKCFIRDLLVREAHGGGLMEYFGINKTYNMLHEHFS